jgi:DNA-binding CsgD family transcriptional regulator
MMPRKVRPLTPTESRVSLLVADGWTHAEVAVELGLAVKTVEWHAARAARKLGVRSREDLAAALARRDDGAPSPRGAPSSKEER